MSKVNDGGSSIMQLSSNWEGVSYIYITAKCDWKAAHDRHVGRVKRWKHSSSFCRLIISRLASHLDRLKHLPRAHPRHHNHRRRHPCRGLGA